MTVPSVPPPFDAEWVRCRPWIEAALAAGGEAVTIDEVEAAVRRGDAHLLAAVDAAVVSQICNRGREFNIYLAGGSLARLKTMVPDLERMAKALGCTHLSILGRRGWERTFLTREMGYTPTAVLLVKEVA